MRLGWCGDIQDNLEANMRSRMVHSKKGLSTMSWMMERKKSHFPMNQVPSQHEQHLRGERWKSNKKNKWWSLEVEGGRGGRRRGNMSGVAIQTNRGWFEAPLGC